MIKEEDRPALRRIIFSVFSIEHDLRDELDAIIKDKSMSIDDRAEKYVDTIIDHLSYYEN